MTKILETRTVEVKKSVEISGQQLVDMLREEGIEIPEGTSVQVFVNVPGGGDYSNCLLDIDEECPITATWTERSEN